MSSVHDDGQEGLDDPVYSDPGDVEDINLVFNHDLALQPDDDDDDADADADDDDEVQDPSISPNILNDLSDGEGPESTDPNDSDFEDLDDSHWSLAPAGKIDVTALQEGYNDTIVELEDLYEYHQDFIQDFIEIRVQEQEEEAQRFERQRAEIRDLKSTIEELEGTISALDDRIVQQRKFAVPWSRSLRDFLNSVEDSSVYRFIYKKSCKQENMSMTLEVFHPDFDLLMEDELPPEAYMSREKPLPENRPAENPLLERRPFPFERLPPAIQAKIFGLVYIRRDLVHCLSRLDPFVPPSDFPADDEKNQSQLPKRFHFGTSPCQIRRARRPNDVLKPLLVCKRWFFIGVHAFYGANTFAFSSLGEFHRFCNGIGEARVERIVNVEIMWHGALMPPQNPQVSERSIGLVWFTKTRRLRTFVAHIAESPKWRRRRGHELYKRKAEDVNRSRLGQRRPNGVLFDDDNHRLSQRPNGGLFNEDGIIEIDTDEDESDDDLYEDDRSVGDQPHGNQQGGNQEPGQARLTGPQLLKRRTARQPNSRMYRSMRTVQGMDNIYQLRGMKWVRFKDRNGDEHRQSIRDWSFIKDINTVVTLPKQPEHALKSQLENLTPLTGLQDWIPAEQDMRIIKMFYNEAPTVDLVGGSDTSGSVGGPSDGSDGGSDGDSSSDGDIHPCDPHHGDGDNSSGGDDHPNNGDGMDVDARSSRSSSNDLFVRSGSGSPGPRSAPMDGMELDPDYPNGPSGNGDGGMLNEADSISGLFVSSRSGSAPPSEPIIIDLTGEVTDDEEEGVSPPSEWSEQVKSESEPDQALGGQTSEMSLNDDPDPDPAQDSESDRGFDREESPPDSDDESDIENYSVSSSSSKRPSDGGGGPSKRPRFN